MKLQNIYLTFNLSHRFKHYYTYLNFPVLSLQKILYYSYRNFCVNGTKKCVVEFSVIFCMIFTNFHTNCREFSVNLIKECFSTKFSVPLVQKILCACKYFTEKREKNRRKVTQVIKFSIYFAILTIQFVFVAASTPVRRGRRR